MTTCLCVLCCVHRFVGNPAVTTVPMAPHRPPPSAPSGMYGSAAPSAPSAPAPSAPDATPLKPSVYGAGSEEDWRDVRGSNPGTIHTSNSGGGSGGSGGGSGAGTGSGSGAGGAGAGGSTPKDTLPEVKWEELDGMTKLGQGSFGVVHKARWRGTLVAVKVPMSQGEDITEEAALLQRVANHPNVLSLIGLCHHPFQAIVLPFMEKGSLEDMVVLEGRQNVSSGVHVCACVRVCACVWLCVAVCVAMCVCCVVWRALIRMHVELCLRCGAPCLGEPV